MYNEQNRFFRRDGKLFVCDSQQAELETNRAGRTSLQGTVDQPSLTNNLLLDFRVGWNKIVFPLKLPGWA